MATGRCGGHGSTIVIGVAVLVGVPMPASGWPLLAADSGFTASGS